MSHKKASFLSPSLTVLLSMIIAIVLGTVALSLPCSRLVEISFIDLLFTATSCTCVTGLLTVPISSFSNIGLGIIMFLMQIGGLGLVTLSLFIVSLFINLGMATQAAVGEMLDLESWNDTRRIILFIIGMTVIAESIGALFLYNSLRGFYPTSTAIFYAIFHSISAFCNAGIILFPNHLVNFVNNWPFLLTIATLMFMGGLGFISWKELFKKVRLLISGKKTPLSLQTKIILRYYGFFTLINTFMFWFLERSNTLVKLSTSMKWVNSFFMAVSCRSGGYFNTYPHEMQNASLFSILINAFIGSGPGSTGSGIKLTTAALLISVINAVITHRQAVEIKGRTIMNDQIYRALSIIILSIAWIIITAILLLISERGLPLVDLLFEVISAFSTLGASIGISSMLSTTGKLLITCSMISGRLGVLTILMALVSRKRQSHYSYPEERLMLL